MSGDVASLASAKNRVEKRIEKMDEYEKKLGMPTFPANKDECIYLDMSGNQLASLNDYERDVASSDLASYGIYIQRTLNKEKSLAKWLEARINLTIANELQSYEGYYSHEQRRNVAISNNAYAKELEEFRIVSQSKIDMLDGLTYQINQLCRVVSTRKDKFNA